MPSNRGETKIPMVTTNSTTSSLELIRLTSGWVQPEVIWLFDVFIFLLRLLGCFEQWIMAMPHLLVAESKGLFDARYGDEWEDGDWDEWDEWDEGW